jgi:DNA invertase Pin-like site-specific DNA recombinase
MPLQRIGYKRVSALDQNASRQLDGVLLDKYFADKARAKEPLIKLSNFRTGSRSC